LDRHAASAKALKSISSEIRFINSPADECRPASRGRVPYMP